ncbi:MAG: prepilin-type N-terminal cleavage/methylation domain-containing protein [Planctomycetota bacterium]|nr:MAG: prepilin-type N-terminal cleavage/methylation domain-containing protein [Planctomycetota bacterium]
MSSPRTPRAGERRSGFTLIELMVAMALMVIIVFQIQVVFSSARRLYERSDAMVQVFQNARNALDILERDLRNAVRTDQMEFFNDRATAAFGRGSYNPGEEIPALRGRFIRGLDYVHALSVKEPQPYTPRMRAEGGPYRWDALYFRTIASIKGVPKEVLVRYDLFVGADPQSNPRRWPVLRRTLIESTGVDPATGHPIIKVHDPVDVCYYVREFAVDLYVPDRSRGTAGRFYAPHEAVAGGRPPAGDAHPPELTRYGSGGEYAVVCVEKGQGQLTSDGDLVTADPLRRIAPGDRMYVLTQPGAGHTPQDFDGPLTIRAIDRSQNGQTRVSFEQKAKVAAALGANPPAVVWRAGWLPAALRITLRIADGKSVEVRTLQRVFKLD